MKKNFKEEEVTMSNEEIDRLVKERTGYGFREASKIAAAAAIAAVEISAGKLDPKDQKNIHDEDGKLGLHAMASAYEALSFYGELALNDANGSNWDIKRFIEVMGIQERKTKKKSFFEKILE